MMAATIKAIGLPTKAFGTSLCSNLSRIVEKMNNTRAHHSQLRAVDDLAKTALFVGKRCQARQATQRISVPQPPP